MIAGLSAILAGYLGGILLMSEVWQIVVISTVNGAGVGLAFSAMPSLILRTSPVYETGAANGLNSLMRAVGTTAASAVVALVLTNMTIAYGSGRIPTREAFQWAFAVGGMAAAAGIALMACVPRLPDEAGVEPRKPGYVMRPGRIRG